MGVPPQGALLSPRLLCALLIPFVPATQILVDGSLGRLRARDEALYLWSGEQVRALAPGLESLAADVYWLRTVQYFGRQRAYAGGKDFRLLKPLIEITATLDPNMEIAYRYGAIFLAEAPPGGAGQPEDAIALLERGARALPGNWRLRQDLGFFHFLFLKDARTASRILDEAALLPGAPGWLRNLAADVLAKGGDRATAVAVWTRIYDQSEGHVKDNAKVQIWMLEAADHAGRLTALVQEFGRKRGRYPHSLQELVSAGLLRQLPADQTNVPFDYDPATGTVTVSRKSPLWQPAA